MHLYPQKNDDIFLLKKMVPNNTYQIPSHLPEN